MAIVRMLSDATMAFELVIHILNIRGCDFGDLLFPEIRFDIGIDVSSVPIQSTGSDSACHNRVQPVIQPFVKRESAVLCQIHALVSIDFLSEFLCQFLLGVRIDVAEDAVAVFLVSHHNSAFPATILFFSYHAITRGSAFTYIDHLL